ncbi:polyprenyl synthetase family protein [Microbulbifer sp. SA54]|uniref:polyprenyl synthetase family protein n=1 Tax=Microbulbifer sp. SA54 TaxID=3401577 RepID=UPI003AAAA3D4
MVNTTLLELLPAPETPPTHLHQAMHYAVMGPGKRLRPLLTLLAANVATDSPVLPGSHTLRMACVSELVHTASLILDDLPCMDDATIRRDRPCTHIRFSESTAILASTNLLNLAYGVIANCPNVDASTKVAVSAHLSHVIGSMGLVGGQVADLQNQPMGARSEIEQLYHQKTGCLFEFSVVTGARLMGQGAEVIEALTRFARAFGLVFQLYDDMLDHSIFALETGKDVQQDAGKTTLLSLYTPEELRGAFSDAQALAREQLRRAGHAESLLAALVEQQFATFNGAAQRLGS